MYNIEFPIVLQVHSNSNVLLKQYHFELEMLIHSK